MGGYVHVVPGDLTRIDADVIGYSTDRHISGDGLMHRAFSESFEGFETALREIRSSLRLPIGTGSSFWVPIRPAGAESNRRAHGIVVTAATGRQADVGTVVRNTLECAVANIRTPERLPLVALPTYLAGFGGAWDDLLQAAIPQVEEAVRFVEHRQLDVAFVAFTDATYHAWTSARREVLRRGGSSPILSPHPELAESVREGECVLFLGAGMSAGAGLPGWKSLVERMADALKVPASQRQDDVGFFLDLAQWYRDGGLKPSVEELIRSAYTSTPNGVKPGLAHHLVAALPIRFYVTTNYDDLMEQALEAQRRYPVRVVSDVDVARTGGMDGCYVVKFHGCAVEGQQVVLSRDDYEDVFSQRPAMASLLEGLLLNQSFYFLGYSLRDPDFRQIYHRVASMLRGSKRPAFAATFERHTEYLLRQWQLRGLDLIPVDGNSTDDQRRALNRMLDGLLESSRESGGRLGPEDGRGCMELADVWQDLRDAADATASCLQVATASNRGEVLALARVMRAFASCGWRGRGVNHAADLFIHLAHTPTLTPSERRELLTTALHYCEDKGMADTIRMMLKNP